MRLLRIEIKGARLFEGECLDMDFFASDRVVHDEDGRVADVTQVGSAGSIYSQNVIGITGVNASGKTTALNLVRFVLRYMAGPYAMRQPYYGSGRIGKLGPSLTATVVFWEDGHFYQLVSRLDHDSLSSGPSSQDDEGGDELAFREETLWRLVAKRPTRLMIESSEEFQANARIILRRNGDPADPTVISEDSRVFLSDQTSIVSKVTGKGLVQVRSTSYGGVSLSLLFGKGGFPLAGYLCVHLGDELFLQGLQALGVASATHSQYFITVSLYQLIEYVLLLLHLQLTFYLAYLPGRDDFACNDVELRAG